LTSFFAPDAGIFDLQMRAANAFDIQANFLRISGSLQSLFQGCRKLANFVGQLPSTHVYDFGSHDF
jgi:hypothetical protein